MTSIPPFRTSSMRLKTSSSLLQLRGPCVLRCEICRGHFASRATSIDSSIASRRRSSSFRMCVAYGKRAAASGAQSAASSAREANAPGVYSSPDDAPHAPFATASRTIAVMRLISSGVAGRSSAPTTIPRMLPSPIIDATFTEPPSLSTAAASAANDAYPPPSPSPERREGNRDPPSWPTTMVVTP